MLLYKTLQYAFVQRMSIVERKGIYASENAPWLLAVSMHLSFYDFKYLA